MHPVIKKWRERARPEQLAPDTPFKRWIFDTGRGFGATTACAYHAIETAIDNPGANIALVPPFADNPDTIDYSARMILWRIMADEMKAGRWVNEPGYSCMTLRNGSKIHTIPANQHDKLRTMEFDLVWIEDMERWKLNAGDQAQCWNVVNLQTRLGDRPHVVINMRSGAVDAKEADKDITKRALRLLMLGLKDMADTIVVDRITTLDNQ